MNVFIWNQLIADNFFKILPFMPIKVLVSIVAQKASLLRKEGNFGAVFERTEAAAVAHAQKITPNDLMAERERILTDDGRRKSAARMKMAFAGIVAGPLHWRGGGAGA